MQIQIHYVLHNFSQNGHIHQKYTQYCNAFKIHFKKFVPLSFMRSNSEFYQTINVKAWPGTEQIKVGEFPASFTVNSNTVIGRRCSQKHK